MTPLDVAALKAVAKELRSHIGKGGGRYLRYGNNVHPSLDTIADGALNEFADTIEASLPTNPVIEVTPEVKEAIETCAKVPWLVNSEKWIKAAAVLRGLLK